MTNCKDNMAQIIVGSETSFSVFLKDSDGRCLDLTPYSGANIVFCNCEGLRTVMAMSIVGLGQLDVTIPSADAANADSKWASADIELAITAGGEKIVVLEDKFEIIKRICPPIV